MSARTASIPTDIPDGHVRVLGPTWSSAVSPATFTLTDRLTSVSKNGGFPLVMSHDRYGELTSAIEDDQSVTAYAYDLAGHLTGIDRPGTAQNDGPKIALTFAAFCCRSP